MDFLEQLRERLDKQPRFSLEIRDSTLIARPNFDGGFEVWASEGEFDYIVGYGGWHEHFEHTDTKAALGCFEFGLSGDCRIQVSSRGDRDYKWVMEALEAGQWIPFSTTGALFSPFWKPRQIRLLTNSTSLKTV